MPSLPYTPLISLTELHLIEKLALNNARFGTIYLLGDASRIQPWRWQENRGAAARELSARDILLLRTLVNSLYACCTRAFLSHLSCPEQKSLRE